MNRNEKIFLLVLTLLVAFAFQGSRGLYETTEGRYAEAAREMLQTGNWLIPQLDYKPHWTKPPLTYWAIAGGMMIFGENEWGARFYNAVAFVALTWTLVALAKRLWDARTAYIAGLICATAPFLIVAENSVHTDMLLSLWGLLVVLCYWRLHKSSGTDDLRYWRAGFWLFAGLGFLTKGPPSVLILAVIGAFHVYLKRTGRPRPKMISALGLFLFLTVGLAWFLAVIFRTQGLLDYYLHDEVYARIFTTQHNRNPQWYGPLVAYLPPLLLGAGPVVAVWPVLFRRERALFRRSRVFALLREDDRATFLFLWLLIPVAVLSFARSRLPLYVLPHFPVIVLATARAVVHLWDHPAAMRRISRLAAAMALVLVLAKGVSAYVPNQKDMRQLYTVCRSLGEGDTEYLAFDCEHLFGLQFYLKGQLTRIAFEPLPYYARQDVYSLIEEIKTSPVHDTYVFVVDHKRDIPVMQSLLENAGLSPLLVEKARHYRVFVVRRSGGISDRAGKAQTDPAVLS